MNLIKRYRDLSLFCYFTSILLGFCGCSSNMANQKQTISNEELSQALVNLYSSNAASSLNDILYQDSTKLEYADQVSKISGYSLNEINQNFEFLIENPDSMIVIQSRAVDTLRAIQERMAKKMLSIPVY